MTPLFFSRVVAELGTPRRVLATTDEAANGAVATLTIAVEGTDFFLLRKDSSDALLSDTWHASVEEAKRQAAFEYEHTSWLPFT